MNFIKTIISVFILSAQLISCNEDFLERYPLDDIITADFFKTPNDLKIYMNRFYTFTYFPCYTLGGNGTDADSHDFNSDNMTNTTAVNVTLNGAATITSTDNSGVGWSFGNVREINFFFENHDRCENKNNDYWQYVGEAHFFRALIYFRLLKTYGDVPWITKVLTTSSPELFDLRTPRHIVADNILAELDEAVRLLTVAKGSGSGRITKWVALAYQSRFALFEGTWQKYHAGTVFGAAVSDPNKYFNKAAAAAKEIMDSGLFDIYNTGKPMQDYADLFNSRNYGGSGVGNKEVIYWTQYSVALGLTNNRNYEMTLPNNKVLTKSLADSYLCTDGKPISVSPLFDMDNDYKTLTLEAANRDPRFRQTIVTPEAPWQLVTGGTTITWGQGLFPLINSANNYMVPTGYARCKMFNPDRQYHANLQEENPFIHIRYAEILLNYAEAKAELGGGTIEQTDLDISVNLLRKRAGMPDLKIDEIADDPKWDFPTLTPVINEIRRERRVELCLEQGLRFWDIMRWAAADVLIVGKRPLGAKATIYDDFRTLQGQSIPIIAPVNADGFFDPLASRIPNGWGFRVNQDYLKPIPQAEFEKNPALTQNPGWPRPN